MVIRKATSTLSLSTLSTGSTASTVSSCRSTFLAATTDDGAEITEDWIYWQRDEHNAQCWTKVYAVLQNEFLWFFQDERKTKTLLLQIAVASVEESGERQLRIVDPNGEGLEMWVLDGMRLEWWRQRLQEAAVLTTQYFNAFPVDVKNLPRDSIYRGSLVSQRRIKKRTRCKAALARILLKWRQSLLPEADRNTI